MSKCSFLQALSQLAPGETVRVEFYAGSRSEELPRRIRIGDNSFWLDEILERKRELKAEETNWREIFICRVEGFLTKLERNPSGQWVVELIK